jgi:hypothetical protein
MPNGQNYIRAPRDPSGTATDEPVPFSDPDRGARDQAPGFAGRSPDDGLVRDGRTPGLISPGSPNAMSR